MPPITPCNLPDPLDMPDTIQAPPQTPPNEEKPASKSESLRTPEQLKKPVTPAYTIKKKLKQLNLAHKLKSALLTHQTGQWFTAIVLIPWALCAIYFTLIASDRYVSEASFLIERSDSGGGSIEGLSLFGVIPQASNDQKILETFIQSPDMLEHLDQKLSLKQHYIESADWISRLTPSASQEDFLDFYRSHINVRYNDTNGMLDMEVQGFEPEYTKKVTDLILLKSESFVNDISHNLANEQLTFVRSEVERAEQRLKDFTRRLLNFQNKTGLLSVEEQGAALSGIMNELQAELIRSQTELQTLTSYLNENSAQVIALKQRISALQSQITTEKDKLVDSEATSLNELAAQQQELQLDLELATQAYTSALVALETTRTEASRKLKQLVVVSSPYQAQDAKYPRVAYSLINILLILLMIFALARMIRATIHEHRD
ncbi:hypothetical protein [Endozoicomonas sp. 8E]|uniref:hypothetical protein n=1 Tax=Endozoicomonas sp. 8E TaxID=3035692 RepID=UPI002939071E|nr:hypothetical protein [Endozoicomonas sp. 8E]WOG29995.1 hypothetical protein P6910_10165 [Endozoicomonas sp. 8E]